MSTPAQREFIDSLPEALRLRVEEHRATLPPSKFQELINGMMEGVIPEGAVWENAQQGANLGANVGFQQYNTGGAIPNLGFVNQQTANYSSKDRIYNDWMIDLLKAEGSITEDEIKDIGIRGYKQVVPRGVV